MTTKDDLWRNLVNSMSQDLPESGASPPLIEKISQPPHKIKDGSQKVYVQRLKTIIYIYTDRQGHAYGEQSYQNMMTIGEVSFAEAINMFKNDPDTKEK